MKAAHATVKATQKCPYYKIKYERIMKRRDKKRAIIATARMMLSAIYAMISTVETFNSCDLQKFDIPEELKKKQIISDAKDIVTFLVSFGLFIEGSISLEALAG